MKEKDVITFYTITLLDLALLALLVGLGYLPSSLSVILWLPLTQCRQEFFSSFQLRDIRKAVPLNEILAEDLLELRGCMLITF